MNREIIDYYSNSLSRHMNVAVYGSGGLPVLGFPTQNSMCLNYEDFGFINELIDFIDSGRVHIFVPDTVDLESWSDENGNPDWRAEIQERYHRFVAEELVPYISSRNWRRPLAMGLSMGANHAAISFLRRPELFMGVLALSGVYDSAYFFHGWMNSTLYQSSPELFLENMPKDHPYIDLYNQKKMIFCVGQGAWEEDGVRSLSNLKRIFDEKGIHAWCDFWGYDVNHDWPWWFKQARYFLPLILEGEGI